MHIQAPFRAHGSPGLTAWPSQPTQLEQPPHAGLRQARSAGSGVKLDDKSRSTRMSARGGTTKSELPQAATINRGRTRRRIRASYYAVLRSTPANPPRATSDSSRAPAVADSAIGGFRNRV